MLPRLKLIAHWISSTDAGLTGGSLSSSLASSTWLTSWLPITGPASCSSRPHLPLPCKWRLLAVLSAPGWSLCAWSSSQLRNSNGFTFLKARKKPTRTSTSRKLTVMLNKPNISVMENDWSLVQQRVILKRSTKNKMRPTHCSLKDELTRHLSWNYLVSFDETSKFVDFCSLESVWICILLLSLFADLWRKFVLTSVKYES